MIASEERWRLQQTLALNIKKVEEKEEDDEVENTAAVDG